MSVFLQEAGPQNPIYGIHHENITERLTRLNWQTKAVVRDNLRGWIYLWISRGRYRDNEGRIRYAYFVKAHSHQPATRIRPYEQKFPHLKAALKYINAEDDGLLARGTWPANPDSFYPPEQQAPFYIGFGRPVKIYPDQ
jgi:hypothetical protein